MTKEQPKNTVVLVLTRQITRAGSEVEAIRLTYIDNKVSHGVRFSTPTNLDPIILETHTESQARELADLIGSAVTWIW